MVLGATGEVSADFVVFTDRTAWESAAGGSPDITDDYNDLTADVYLSTNPDRGAYTPSSNYATGSRLDDYPSSIYAENNVDGTDFLLAFIRDDDFYEYITFTFDSPVISWGADIDPGAYTSRQIDFNTNGGDTGYYTTPSADNAEFRGFVATNPFTSVDFSVASGFTAQGLDNFGAHSIPEPTTLCLLASGALILGIGRLSRFVGRARIPKTGNRG
jgi:hypothetical protein